jgi:aspartate/glutamate racemase
VYPDAFGRRGIEARVPPPAERAMIDRVILEELCDGVVAAAFGQELPR